MCLASIQAWRSCSPRGGPEMTGGGARDGSGQLVIMLRPSRLLLIFRTSTLPVAPHNSRVHRLHCMLSRPLASQHGASLSTQYCHAGQHSRAQSQLREAVIGPRPCTVCTRRIPHGLGGRGLGESWGSLLPWHHVAAAAQEGRAPVHCGASADQQITLRSSASSSAPDMGIVL